MVPFERTFGEFSGVLGTVSIFLGGMNGRSVVHFGYSKFLRSSQAMHTLVVLSHTKK